jgi:uncharacterized RDD family membrane protein YckC
MVLILGVLVVLALGLYVGIGPDDDPTTDDSAGFGALAGLGGFLVIPLYFGLFQGGGRGQSLGKRAIHIAVRRADTLDRLGYPRSFARAFVALAFWLLAPVWILNYLWPLWDQRHQTLNDKVAGSVVIRH